MERIERAEGTDGSFSSFSRSFTGTKSSEESSPVGQGGVRHLYTYPDSNYVCVCVCVCVGGSLSAGVSRNV